jgi:hypothetical protein
LNPSSQPGPLATMSSADYAQLLKTLCLAPNSSRRSAGSNCRNPAAANTCKTPARSFSPASPRPPS